MPGADPASQPGGPARSAVTFAGVSAHWWARIGGRAAVLVVALFLAGSAAAQQRAAFGAEVGYSRADMIGEASDLVEARQGAITGVYLHLPLNRVLSLRPELLFSLRGGRTLVRVADPPSIADLDIELAYFEVPVLARAALPRGRFRPVVFGGPSLAVQIGCDFVLTGDTSSTRLTCGQPREGEEEPPPLLDQIRGWDLAWIAGAAIEMHLPRTVLALQGRYTAGTRSILEGPVDLRNRGVAVLFGLTF